MAGERKIIRDSVAQVLSIGVGYPIFFDRNLDSRSEQSFINIFFQSGSVEFDGVVGITSAEFVIAFNTQDVKSDDELDGIADAIDMLITSGDIAKNVLAGVNQVGWEYSSDAERAFTGFSLRYSLVYVVN